MLTRTTILFKLLSLLLIIVFQQSSKGALVWLKGKESSCLCRRRWFLHQEDHLEKEMAPTPILLPGKSFGQRSLAGYSSWGHRETQLSD